MNAGDPRYGVGANRRRVTSRVVVKESWALPCSRHAWGLGYRRAGHCLVRSGRSGAIIGPSAICIQTWCVLRWRPCPPMILKALRYRPCFGREHGADGGDGRDRLFRVSLPRRHHYAALTPLPHLQAQGDLCYPDPLTHLLARSRGRAPA